MIFLELIFLLNYHELYHARGHTGKTIINYRENFERVQSELWLMIVDDKLRCMVRDTWWSNESETLTRLKLKQNLTNVV